MKRKLPLLLPTASSLERAERCPTSFCLAQVIATNEDAERGTAIHAFVAQVLSGIPAADALELVADKETKATCTALDIRSMVGDLDNVRPEVAYAFDTKTRAVRELGVMIDRRYSELEHPPTEDELVGTVDAEGMRLSGIAVTGDLKSGFLDQTDPEHARQSHFAAVTRRRSVDAEHVEARIWRVGESGKVKTLEHTFSGFALDELEDDLVAIHAGVVNAHERMQAGETLQVSPGSWCRYCPSKPVCPAFAGLAREMLPNLARVGGMIAGVMKMTPPEQFEIYARVKEAAKLIDEILPRLNAIAKHAPFVSADGTREVALVAYEKESFSKELAIALLNAKGATADEIASLYSTTTIESVRMKPVKKSKRGKAA